MEIITIQKNIHTSPRKLRLVADMVRKMGPRQALNSLRFTKKSAASPLSKAILTALANARQQKADEEVLVFKSMEINEGPRMRRFRAQARGRANPFKRRMSHIKIVLSDETGRDQIKPEKIRKSEDQLVSKSAPIESGSEKLVKGRKAGK